MLDALEDWKQHAIDDWMEATPPWYYLSEQIGEMMAPLVGAKKDEVIATGSIIVNLHQLIATFYKLDGKRTKILADELNFPSYIYAIQNQLNLYGYDAIDHLIQVKSTDGRTLNEADIIQ